MENLLKFWTGYTPSATDKFHPDDREDLEASIRHQNVVRCASLEEYIGSNENHRTTGKIHANLLPQPFLGDLKNADIYFVLFNPGFSDASYYEADCKALSERIAANLSGAHNEQYPFMYLDPNLCWTGGYRWWEQRLYPYVSLLGRKDGYHAGAKALSKRVAAVELFAYASRTPPWDGKKRDDALKKIPSSKVAIEAISAIVEKAKTGNAVVMFKRNAAELLGIEEKPEENLYKCGSNQGFQIGLKSVAGKRLKEWLGC